MALNLPSNAKLDPNTGLYVITSPTGQTYRVGADSQAQLDAYVNAVNTNTPTSVNVTNAATGVTSTKTFDPVQISQTTNSIASQQALLTQTKRQTGIVGNADGTYSDLRTGQTLTQEQAAQKISAAGLPPEALAAITPKSSPAYQTAVNQVNQTVNTPSNTPQAPNTNSTSPNPAISSDNANISPSTDPQVNATEATPIAAEQTVGQPTRIADDENAVASITPVQEQNLSETTGYPLPTAGEEIEGQGLSSPQPVFDDEFGGIDEQVVANENALQEPPVLSEEETDQYLSDIQNEEQVENEFPAPIGEEDPFEQQRIEAEQALNRQELVREEGGDESLTQEIRNTQSSEADQQTNNSAKPDWRVRLSLAPSANYLYKASDPGPVLKPLAATNGVIFPYTPQVNVQYAAHYDSQDIVHSNYKIYSYRNSAIDSLTINGVFTAQDNNEANYLLAVIHFFRSVTKMFYGKDTDPRRGIPPPLCYLTGLGTFQFDKHPLLITNFNYNLPDDVDYIRAGQATSYAGVSTSQYNTPTTTNDTVLSRITANRVPVGGINPAPSFQARTPAQPTYVPTKMQIQLTCIPIVSRNDISNRFSVKSYATGSLLRGSQQQGGGIW